MKDPISGRRRLVLIGLVVVGVSTIIFVRFDSRDDDGNFEFERYVGRHKTEDAATMVAQVVQAEPI